MIDDVRVKINRAAPRLRIEFVQILSDVINDLAGAAKPVEIKMFGSQLDTLERYATALAPKIQAIDGRGGLVQRRERARGGDAAAGELRRRRTVSGWIRRRSGAK